MTDRVGERRSPAESEKESSATMARASTLRTKDTFSRQGPDRASPVDAIRPPVRDNIRTYAELSANQKRLLGPDGEQIYERLSFRNKAAFIVLTTRMDQNGVDYSGMRLKQTQEQGYARPVNESERHPPASGRERTPQDDLRRLPPRPLSPQEQIQVDRLLLEQDPADLAGEARFRASIEAGGIGRSFGGNGRWIRDKPRGHTGMDQWGVRENRTTESMQIGIGPHGAFVDIDRFNYRRDIPFGFFGHSLEVLTPGKTDIFQVARALRIDVFTRTAPRVPPSEAPPRDEGL